MRPIRPSGFTLIELLIVVAIIAILAAIAVPNFLEAQTRAKASAMKNDIRTLTTGIEAYHVDNQAYPPHRDALGGEILYPDRYRPLTTPVAFINSIPLDVFFTELPTGPGAAGRFISWTNIDNFESTHALDPARHTHRWLLRSRGPDGQNEGNSVRNAYLTLGIASAPSFPYDPTNGTTSRGDISRTAILVPQ